MSAEHNAAARVRAAMGLRDLRRVDLAGLLECEQSALTRYLSGELSLEKCAGLVSLGRIARVLDVSEASLRYGGECDVCGS